MEWAGDLSAWRQQNLCALHRLTRGLTQPKIAAIELAGDSVTAQFRRPLNQTEDLILDARPGAAILGDPPPGQDRVVQTREFLDDEQRKEFKR